MCVWLPDGGELSVKQSCLTFVDLAGSERVAKTGTKVRVHSTRVCVCVARVSFWLVCYDIFGIVCSHGLRWRKSGDIVCCRACGWRRQRRSTRVSAHWAIASQRLQVCATRMHVIMNSQPLSCFPNCTVANPQTKSSLGVRATCLCGTQCSPVCCLIPSLATRKPYSVSMSRPAQRIMMRGTLAWGGGASFLWVDCTCQPHFFNLDQGMLSSCFSPLSPDRGQHLQNHALQFLLAVAGRACERHRHRTLCAMHPGERICGASCPRPDPHSPAHPATLTQTRAGLHRPVV